MKWSLRLSKGIKTLKNPAKASENDHTDTVLAEPSNIAPPPRPPPLFHADSLQYLAKQGHLPITLPEDLARPYEDLFSTAEGFFTQPKDAKATQYPAGKGFELGYIEVQDEKQYITLRYKDGGGTGSPEIDRLGEEIWRRTAALLHRTLCDLSEHIGIPYWAWEPVVNDTLTMPDTATDASTSLIRVFSYQPYSGVAEQHKDLGLLTLCMGAGQGLQVWRIDETHADGGEWIDAKGPMLLAGNTLRILTQARVNSGLHRVVANPEGRMSIVFAWRPCIKHYFPLTPFGVRDEVCDMKELWQMIRGNAWNINAPKEVRERQREQWMQKNKELMKNS